MKTLAERLTAEMQRCELTQDQLAQKAGMAQSSIHKLVTGKARESRKISKIAAVLGVNTDWLATGDGEKYKIGAKTIEKGVCLEGQLDTIKLGTTSIPLINFNNAGRWREELGNHSPGHGDYMITPGQFGKDVFAVCVPSDSMQPEFNKDDTVLIDPNRVPKHGDYILTEHANDIVLRQYWREAGQWYLKPLNERYDMVTLGDSLIIGVVIKKTITKDYV